MKLEGAPDSYKVMFDKNGGDSVSVESLTRDDGAAIGTLPTAAREDYDFDGWFTASEGGTKISGSTVVTGDVTYYAHWTQRKPVTYTIIYNVTEGEGSVARQTCEFGEEVYVDDGGTLHWEGHYFMGWAFAPDGDVAYRAGDTVAEPTNGDSVTLYAKWLPELTLEPMLADWSKGSITLLLGNAAELRGKKYSIWCRRGGDSNAQWWEITGDGYVTTEWLDGEKLKIKDAAFYARYDGIQPVEYRVTDEYGRKAKCMTRVKFAIAVGLDEYDPSMGCENLPGMEAYAETFTNLAIRAGAKEEQVIALTGRRANLYNLDKMFKYIHDTAKPGDVCLLYFGTHGGHKEFIGYNLALYKERYSVQRAFEHISALGEGIAVVGFVHACGSGGFTIGDQWMQNVAWITATDSPHIYTVDTHFSRFLLDYGWQGGWAGTSGKPLTFGQLADYMGKSHDKFFSGLVLDGNTGEIKAKVCNKELLGRIGAGICAIHSGEKPAAFTVNASKNNPDAVVLNGFSIQKSTHVAVFKRFAGQEKFSLSLGGPELVLLDKNRENIVRIEADWDPKGGQHSSPSNPMEFIVKAYNGAGVTAADLVQGWRAAMAAQTEDGRTWNYGKVDGGLSIVSAAESSASGYGDALKGDVAIPSTLNGMSIVSISSHAFEGCEEITSVTIPDSVTSIGSEAFRGCSGLTSVKIPDGVTSIGEGAFSGCSGLASVTIPNSMTSIVKRVFSGCSGLTNVTIPNSVESIGYEAFCECCGLTSVYVSFGDADRVKGLMKSSGFDVTKVSFIELGGVRVAFDANGGEVVEQNRTVAADGPVGELPTPTRSGYTFAGWFTAMNGGAHISASTVVTENVTYYAHWTVNQYTVTFNANGGTGGKSMKQNYGSAIVAPTVTRTGYTFAGWSPAVAATVPANNVTYNALWSKNQTPTPTPTPIPPPTPTPEPEETPVLFEEVEGEASASAASEYNGYLYDEKSGAVKGTIQVKVGKPGKKDGKAMVKATVVVGTKKIALKGAEMGKAVIASDEPTEIDLVGKGAEECSVMLGAYGITGYYGAYVIDGARNIFSSKDKGDIAEAKDALDKCLGSRMVIWDGGSVSVSIAAKGKVKVSGTLASGAKVSATAVLLVGEEWNCVSVAAPKANLSFVLWLSRDGKTTMVEGLGDDVLVGNAGTLADGAVFSVPTDAALWSAIPGEVLTEYLPNGVPVTKKGTKWTLPKVGRITMKKGVIDVSKAGENPSGLKLTYKSLDGTFKGSFKVYAENKGKLKATTVNVTGFLLNGIGFGTATIKKVGSVSIRIE